MTDATSNPPNSAGNGGAPPYKDDGYGHPLTTIEKIFAPGPAAGPLPPKGAA
jgi:hypothetical protein